MKNMVKLLLLSLVLFSFSSCMNSVSPKEAQQITGQVDVYSFLEVPTSVQIISGTKVIASSPIAKDGSFALYAVAGKDYRIVFNTASSKVNLVFPRTSGTIDKKFNILGVSKSFSLGKIRYIGNPNTKTYVFSNSLSKFKSNDGDNVEYQCEDGVDPDTGAVCIDDEDDEGVTVCEDQDVDNQNNNQNEDENMSEEETLNNENEDENMSDDDNVNCENGIDPDTGLECDGGSAENAQDENSDENAEEQDGENSDDIGNNAEEQDGENNDSEENAVAEHNLPSSVGCASTDNDQNEDENEDVNNQNNQDEENQDGEDVNNQNED